jgi:hypothetical protein
VVEQYAPMEVALVVIIFVNIVALVGDNTTKIVWKNPEAPMMKEKNSLNMKTNGNNMKHKQIFDDLSDAHTILCDACQEMYNNAPWYSTIPLINWKWWRAYTKINRARNYIYKQTNDEYFAASKEITENIF